MSDASPWVLGFVPRVKLEWAALKKDRSRNRCPHCHIDLLSGEEPGFCCGPKGSQLHRVAPLPPLPEEYNVFLHHPDISKYSRILNLIFSFASMESTAFFPQFADGPPGHMAVQGKLYHRIRPDHANSGMRWVLYDAYMMETAPFSHTEWFSIIPPSWIEALSKALLRVNPLSRSLLQLSRAPASGSTLSITLEDGGTDEIAAIMSFDNTTESQIKARKLVISRHDGRNQKVPCVSRHWEPLVYPLLFPHATLGWGLSGSRNLLEDDDEPAELDTDATTTQMWHYRARLLRDERFQIFGRLANEYLCDMFTRNLETRLRYIRDNQARIRKEDAALMGLHDTDELEDQENIYLPASFIGSRAWTSDQISDALAIAADGGSPTFFITMTCNPEWEEIQCRLRPGQTWQDIPVVIARVFHRKLALLFEALRKLFCNAGRQIYRVHSIEFQKRGLPHAHILIKYEHDCLAPSDIDRVVSAEVPDEPEDQQLVLRWMRHKHPEDTHGHVTIPDYCQRTKRGGTVSRPECRFSFPQKLQEHTTVDLAGRVHLRRRHQRDRWIVSYCLPLLRQFQCHLNVEVANSSHLFQYLFKYILKGLDKTRFRVHDGSGVHPPPPLTASTSVAGLSSTSRAGQRVESVDEIEDYWSARYLSAGEAAWRIMGFHIARKIPAVSALPIHLIDSRKRHQYQRRGVSSTLSLLNRYFMRPVGAFQFRGQHYMFDDLKYAEYFSMFRLAPFLASKVGDDGVFEEIDVPQGQVRKHVILRCERNRHLSRIVSVRPTQGELFYLRALLLHRRARSWEDARTVDGIIYSTFQEAATALGLFAHEKEAEYAMLEAVTMRRTPHEIRLLFLHLLTNGCCTPSLAIWDTFKNYMAADFYFQHNGNLAIAHDMTLQEIGRLLEEHGQTLADHQLPQPTVHANEVMHELVRWNGSGGEAAARAAWARSSFTAEQRLIFDTIMTAVVHDTPLLAFVDGKAGRGKTFLFNAICDQVRSMNKIVLATATSAFAAQLYPGGRTTHNAFKVPVNDKNELLQSPIKYDSQRGELIREMSVCIWDEAPMANKAVLACVEEVHRIVTHSDVPFGGKVVILSGDFRQTCPVIRRGTRRQVVDASIRSSHLWPLFQIFRLTAPIRNASDPQFAAWVDSIGEGFGPDVPMDMINKVDSEESLIDFVYPGDMANSPTSCLKRSILCPTNAQIDAYNGTILNRVDGAQRTYMAADTLKEVEDAELESPDSILDFVARQTPPGLPAHSLTIKTNGVYRLLRNFSLDRGLVKNVRVVITNIGNRLITVRILRDRDGCVQADFEEILIPRIIFEYHVPSTGHTLLRRQFPLAPAYATTFNSCQGLTLDLIGVDLTRPVFSHGQLYTALSRVRVRQNVAVLLRAGELSAVNVTYKELLL